MSPAEIIALIFSVIIIVKLIAYYALKPGKIEKLAEKVFKNSIWPTVIFIIVATILVAYITAEISVPQMMAAAFLGMILMIFVFIQYPKAFQGMMKEMATHRNAAILPWIIFVALAAWTLYALFV